MRMQLPPTKEPSSTCNLHVEVLVPYSKWRITYNGFLRVHASNEMHVIEEYRHVILTILCVFDRIVTSSILINLFAPESAGMPPPIRSRGHICGARRICLRPLSASTARVN